MQSGMGKSDKWVLEFETNNPTKNPLMGWESSDDPYTEIRLEFSTKELASYISNKTGLPKKIIYNNIIEYKSK